MYIVIIPGTTYVGPFESHAAAIDYLDKDLIECGSTIEKLLDPKEDEESDDAG